MIWKQIIKYAKVTSRGIIYVTHDQKEDWWNIVKGKTIGPRIELRKEFMTETQQEFHMYSMHSFINTYNKMNNNLIDKSAVEEVIGLEKANKKNGRVKRDVKTVSLSEKITRTEETLIKVQNRIDRRKKIMVDIENKYQNQGIELPEHIRTQYDNTKVKRQELEEIYEKKLRELEGLKQMSKMS